MSSPDNTTGEAPSGAEWEGAMRGVLSCLEANLKTAHELLSTRTGAAATPVPEGWRDLFNEFYDHLPCQFVERFEVLASAGKHLSIPLQQLDAQLTQVINQRDECQVVLDDVLDIVLGKDRPEWSNAYGFRQAVDQVREQMASI